MKVQRRRKRGRPKRRWLDKVKDGSDNCIVAVVESLHKTINIVAPQFHKTRYYY